MAFIINCPSCGQKLEAEDEHIGMTTDCPTCSRPFTVRHPEGESFKPPLYNSDIVENEERARCPFCGELILAIARKCKHCGEFVDGSHSTQTEPPAQVPNVVLPEKTIWEGSPSYWNYSILFLLGVISAPISGIGIILIAFAFLDRKYTDYRVTTKRVSCKKGIISNSLQEVSLKDIRSIHLKQGVIDSLLNIGTVAIGSAGHAGLEIKFKGVPDPQTVKEMISKLKD
jgi:predicted RNA-binding Zn-ribbon protein involved in translation (DUF1610 family)